MNVSDHAHRLRDEAGFTLIEILAAMVLTVIVLFAVLSLFDNFLTNAARQTRITDANEQVRVAMDRIVSDLRQARTVEVAGPLDLVYTVTDSATAVRRERVCVDSSSRLWRSSVTTATAPTTPIASGTTCPTAGSGAALVTTMRSANSVSNPLFTYDTSTAASVRNIGLSFALTVDTAEHSDTSRLRASAFVRAQSETAPDVDPDDITTLCNGSIPTLTLSAGVGPLTVQYTDIDGNSLGAATAAGSGATLPSGETSVVATITATSGAITQLVKTIAC